MAAEQSGLMQSPTSALTGPVMARCSFGRLCVCCADADDDHLVLPGGEGDLRGGLGLDQPGGLRAPGHAAGRHQGQPPAVSSIPLDAHAVSGTALTWCACGQSWAGHDRDDGEQPELVQRRAGRGGDPGPAEPGKPTDRHKTRPVPRACRPHTRLVRVCRRVTVLGASLGAAPAESPAAARAARLPESPVRVLIIRVTQIPVRLRCVY